MRGPLENQLRLKGHPTPSHYMLSISVTENGDSPIGSHASSVGDRQVALKS